MSPQPSREPAHTARTRTCALCAEPVNSSRARYCSRACQQRAFRVRHAAPLPDLTEIRQAWRRTRTLTAHTIYECPTCEMRFLGERRCGDCNTFCRALGLGGACLDCDALILLVELVGEEVWPVR